MTSEETAHGISQTRLQEIATTCDVKTPVGFLSAMQQRSSGALPDLERLVAELESLRTENASLKKQLEQPPPKSRRSLQIIALAASHDGLGYRGEAYSKVPGEIAGAANELGLSIGQAVVSQKLSEAVADLAPQWPTKI